MGADQKTGNSKWKCSEKMGEIEREDERKEGEGGGEKGRGIRDSRRQETYMYNEKNTRPFLPSYAS